MTAHTSTGCFLGGANCYSTLGCSQTGGDYGTVFNANKGGFYAMEWTSEAIRIWFFQRGKEPKDILAERPDTSTWGAPQGNFVSGTGANTCNIDDHFRDHQLVFDTTFCGKSSDEATHRCLC